MHHALCRSVNSLTAGAESDYGSGVAGNPSRACHKTNNQQFPMTDRIKAVTASDWGPALHKTARLAAIIAALLICLVELTIELARQTREAIDARNEQLSAWWVDLLQIPPSVTTYPALLPAVAIAAPPAPPVAPSERPRPPRKAAVKAAEASSVPRPAKRRKAKSVPA